LPDEGGVALSLLRLEVLSLLRCEAVLDCCVAEELLLVEDELDFFFSSLLLAELRLRACLVCSPALTMGAVPSRIRSAPRTASIIAILLTEITSFSCPAGYGGSPLTSWPPTPTAELQCSPLGSSRCVPNLLPYDSAHNTFADKYLRKRWKKPPADAR
jgi:hypothetical protein